MLDNIQKQAKDSIARIALLAHDLYLGDSRRKKTFRKTWFHGYTRLKATTYLPTREEDNQEENVQQARQALICDEITKKSIVPLSTASNDKGRW